MVYRIRGGANLELENWSFATTNSNVSTSLQSNILFERYKTSNQLQCMNFGYYEIYFFLRQNGLAKGNGGGWYGHVLKRDCNDMLR